ncbi:gamma-glutamylcyclotransferase [bacterium]|nr:gamma-glutamylcyclotransferase [bacterium]
MKYFAYGSNMDPEQMKQRGIKLTQREWAILKNWRLEFNKIASRNPKEGYANIVRDNNEAVEGILYEISEEDVKKLNKWERYPIHYDRTTVKVNLKDGREINTLVYIAQPDKVRNGLKPTREYLAHLLKGCDLLSKEYCEKLKKWEILD